ncbi:MAG: helix-turn-helix domain-containing protein [Candidatus Competibacterales bacterium]|nr:helix-turn-helix domain-containing protein [Candidatus Competibacterales bacterium]
MTQPLTRIVRCLHQAQRRLSINEIAARTELPEAEVRVTLQRLHRHGRIALDESERAEWIPVNDPETTVEDAWPLNPTAEEPRFIGERLPEQIAVDADHATVPFRSPPSAPDRLQGTLLELLLQAPGMRRIEIQAKLPQEAGKRITRALEQMQEQRLLTCDKQGRYWPQEADRATLIDWRRGLIVRPEDIDELVRIQREVIETMRSLEAPPPVLKALERIADLLES